MIHEIANANNIPHDVAVLKFLNDLAEKPVLGYVAKLNVLKSLVEKKEVGFDHTLTVARPKERYGQAVTSTDFDQKSRQN